MNERQGVIFTAHGHLKGSEAVDAVREVNAADLAGTPVLYSFFDFNGITGLDISTTHLHQIADIAVATSKQKTIGRVVAACAKNDLQFGLVRMWQVYVEETGWQTHVLRDRVEAIDWIRERVAKTFGLQAELNRSVSA